MIDATMINAKHPAGSLAGEPIWRRLDGARGTELVRCAMFVRVVVEGDEALAWEKPEAVAGCQPRRVPVGDTEEFAEEAVEVRADLWERGHVLCQLTSAHMLQGAARGREFGGHPTVAP